LKGVENCQAEGLKVGLRFTINKRNDAEIPPLFNLVESLEVPRICFYHLVYSGRALGVFFQHAEIDVGTVGVVQVFLDQFGAAAGIDQVVETDARPK